jgi:hypothetical protein
VRTNVALRLSHDGDAAGVITNTITCREEIMGRAFLLWLLGVPISVIILLALFWH